jgi:Cas10/Cmr2, second palm domain
VGKQTLVVLDTHHIKQYVFATDRLKEIRGASSILDHLNRRVMKSVAQNEFHAEKVYANGGSGLFLVDGDKEVAEKFGQRIQQEYLQRTRGGASITFAVQEIPDNVQDAWNEDIWDTLELLRYNLAETKSSSPDSIALPSHPFLRLCDACGTRYAEMRDPDEAGDEASRDRCYCDVCMMKRREDGDVKDRIDEIIAERNRTGEVKDNETRPFAWEKVISLLKLEEYPIPKYTQRPPDFNELRGISGGKDYLGLIYADGNGMGQLMSELRSLEKIKAAADLIDDSVYAAMGDAIKKHLKVIDEDTSPMFPFDILLIGGDDIMIVTPASIALDVAYTLATTFSEQTRGKGPGGKSYTLSVGVVLAPVKYPFGLLQDLAESTLKAAKKEGANASKESATRRRNSAYDETFINFMTVTGSTSLDFKKVYQSLVDKKGRVDGQKAAFYATLRPYTIEGMQSLLDAIRNGKKERLGRTKLHQVREAVLRMNLTTSVYEGVAVLRNWKPSQREFVTQHVYTLGNNYQEAYRDAEKPGTLFPRVIFPWFADGADTYRTSLLDFVELYDFVAQEGVDDAD